MQELGGLLAEFLRQAGKNEEVAVILLNSLWPRVIGDELALKTRPLTLSRKHLILGVESESWRKQLEDVRGQLVASINRFWGASLVERISFKIHPIEETAALP